MELTVRKMDRPSKAIQGSPRFWKVVWIPYRGFRILKTEFWIPLYEWET